jgi:uncharacterized protein YecT (DUF1311 family)
VVQDDSVPPRASASTGRPLLFGGIAAACLMGAGVGLWARPGAQERPGALQVQPTAPAPRPDRRLAIVVDDAPAPVGKPLEVLAPARPRPAIAPPRPPAPPPAAVEPVAPARPPNGLVRVVAPVPGPLASALGHKPAPPTPVPAPAAAPRTKPAKPAAVAAPTLHKAALKAKPDKRHAHDVKVVEAPSPPTKSRHGLGAITHAFAKLAPHHAPREPTSRAEAAPPRRKAAETRLAKAEPRRPKPEPAAPIRVANVQARCASPDPGEALACGDPSLSAAERRLNRAYREAQDAGVPAATLERQQQRWRATRAAAAREAPWAVRDVYQARIAELQDLARNARGD